MAKAAKTITSQLAAEPKISGAVVKLVSVGTPLLVVAILAYLGERGADGGLMQDVWNAAKTASPFAAMLCLMLMLDERRERRSAQTQCADRTIDFINATNEANQALSKMADAVERRSNRR